MPFASCLTSLRAAIFDLDGTLLDSMPVWDDLGEKYLLARGKTPRPGLRAELAPLSMVQTAEYLIAQYGISDSVPCIMDQINAMVEDFYLHAAPEKPGVRRLLDYLRAQGVPMCVATATDRPLVEGALERLGLLSYFSGILTCTEVGAGKDRPDIYWAALRHLGADQAHALVFEDALHAIETAKAAGFAVAAIEDESMAAHHERIRALADYYLTSYETLPLPACK